MIGPKLILEHDKKTQMHSQNHKELCSVTNSAPANDMDPKEISTLPSHCGITGRERPHRNPHKCGK